MTLGIWRCESLLVNGKICWQLNSIYKFFQCGGSVSIEGVEGTIKLDFEKEKDSLTIEAAGESKTITQAALKSWHQSSMVYVIPSDD